MSITRGAFRPNITAVSSFVVTFASVTLPPTPVVPAKFGASATGFTFTVTLVVVVCPLSSVTSTLNVSGLVEELPS